MDKDKLKQIRWFSNGVWQFQPHLYFLFNLCNDQDLFDSTMQQMEKKESTIINGLRFKLED